MDDYISKPIAPDVLFATLAKHVDLGETYQATQPILQERDQQGIKSEETSSREIVDFEKALTQVPGGIDVLRDLAKIFLGECPKLMQDLRKGLADSDSALAQRAAHTIKGAARILAANQLIEISGELELAAKNKDLDTVQSRLGEIEKAVNQACDVIRKWLE